jgi:1,4-alpha-glucan branching enzyme
MIVSMWKADQNDYRLAMKKILFILLFSVTITTTWAQLLTWSPAFPQENDAATDVVITVDATKGNQGLLNYMPTTDVYVHIGVITNFSTSPTNWRYVRNFGVPDNQVFTTAISQLNAIFISSNKWKYTIVGGLRSFFGITDATEHIQRIAILFRSGNGSKVQRNADGSDMYIPVYDNSILAVRFTDPPFQPYYTPIPEPLSKTVGDNISLTAIANKSSTMKLYLNGTVIQAATNVTSISANPSLAIAGNTVIVAEANDGTTTKTDTLRFFVTGGITIAPLPAGVRDGINYDADNTAATLVLYAPLKNRVSIIGEFTGSNWAEQSQYQMNKTPDGNYWWLRITGLTAGTEYAFQYLVDGTLKIADPYAEKILDPYNNNDQNIPASAYPNLKSYPAGLTTGIVSILQTASPQYTWQVNNFTKPDKRKLVIYELLVRDFLAAHDWNTLRDTLNYLKNLGVNAIELMPFNEFEGNNSWGYNPDFYFAPDKYYGPKNTLKLFIDSCHKKGIAVVMDIVMNHTYGLSPLAQLYWDAANNRPAANNPWYNPVAPHAFGFGNDFNHSSSATKYFFNRVLQHWMTEYKIDGYRFDFSKGLTQKSSSNDQQFSAYDTSRIAIINSYANVIKSVEPNAYVILEHFCVNQEEKELSDSGMLVWGNLNDSYAQASMGYTDRWDFSNGIYTVRNWTQPNLVTYMESHDEERLMYKNLQFGNSSGSYSTKDLNTALKRIEMCGAFLFTIPGPKMLWEFGEMGYDFSINRCEDGTIDNNCRLSPKPIHWDYLQYIQRKRLHDVFAELIKLRFHSLYKDVFITNQVSRSLSTGFKWLQITTDSSKICVVGNFDVVSQTGSVSFQNAGTWYDYIDGSTISATGTAQSITLQPGEYHVYLNRNVASGLVTAIPPINSNRNGLFVNVYPNPAAQDVAIDINLTESGNVQIDLLNVAGQKLVNIYSGFLSRGAHRISFANNKRLPAGLYLLQMNTKTLTGSVRLILK